MAPVPQRTFIHPDRRPTRPDLPAAKVTRCSTVSLSETTPTPLLPPPGPRPARASIPPDERPIVQPDDLPLDLLLGTVPRVVRSKEELDRAPIEHRDCYVLALLDGRTSVRGLVEIAGMAHDDVLRVLRRLRRLGLIVLH